MKKRWFLTNHRHLFACGGKFLKIMKITIFIVVFASMQTFALDNYAQTKRMDVKVDESSIVAALEKIEVQSEFFFFYNNKVVKLDKKVSVDLKDKTITEILDVVVKGTTNGTITDANGNYSLLNIPANATLQFSFVGMKTQEVKIESQTVVN